MTWLRRLILASGLFVSLTSSICQAQPKLLCVILLPKTSLADWRSANAPHLHALMATGALAVMNTRTARLPNDKARETLESAVCTLGAGARAAGGLETTAFFPPDAHVPGFNVSAGALYARRMGLPPPQPSLININWPMVLSENTGRGYDIHPGNLGDALAAHGVAVEAGKDPLPAIVAVTHNGTVLPQSNGTRYRDTFIIYDGGNSLADADKLIGTLQTRISMMRGRLLMISPCVSDQEYVSGERLSPVVLWGDGVQEGVLYSPSTRRAGLVTNTDFAPTVAAYFGVTALPYPADGRVWQTRGASDPVMRVSRWEAQAYRQARGMRLLPYLAIILGIWMIVGSVLAARGRLPTDMAWPPVFCLLALVIGVSAVTWAAGVVLFFLTLCLLRRWISSYRAVVLGASVLYLLLIADLCFNDPLMRQCLLGYSAVEGARYYGMGNEAMGVLIGACLLVVASLWNKARNVGRVGLAGTLLLVTCLLSSPAAGAKAGGLLVSLAAFGTLIFRLYGGRWNGRAASTLLILCGLALGALAIADAHQGNAQQSHMGVAVHRIMSGGFGEASAIIQRKLATEGRLLYHSAWACTLWGGVAGLCALQRQRISKDCDAVTTALRDAGYVAILACLLVNDAGVVAASLCLVLLWCHEAAKTSQRLAT